MPIVMGDSWGGNFRRDRRALGLSLAEVAEGICSVSYLSLVESDKRLPSESIRVKLVARLETGRSPEPEPIDIDGLLAAEICVRLGQLDKADEYLALLPDLPTADYLRGVVLDLRGDLDGACAKYQEVLNNSSSAHTTRIRAQIAFSRTLLDQGAIESARRIGEEALAEAAKQKWVDSTLLTELHTVVAQVYRALADHDRFDQLISAPELQASLTPRQRAAAEWDTAVALGEKRNRFAAADHAQAALGRLRALDVPIASANRIITAVMATLDSASFGESTVRAQLAQADTLLHNGDATLEFARYYSAVAELESLVGDTAAAEKAIKQATDIATNADPGTQAQILISAAVQYYRLNNAAASEAAAQQARTLLESGGKTRSAAVSWQRLGTLYEELNDAKSALFCYKQANELVGVRNQSINVGANFRVEPKA